MPSMMDRSKIGLGTAQFGMNYGAFNKTGQTPASEVGEILGLADEEEIKLLDSASAYGSAEEILGTNDLRKFQVVSKFLPPSQGGNISIQLNRSLERLRLTTLYAYLAHRPLEMIDSPEQWEELKKLKANKKVKKIGFSLNDPKEIPLLLDAGFWPDLVQVPYNYFDRRFEGVMQELKNNRCEIHTRSVFLQGLFFEDTTKLENFFDVVKEDLRNLQKRKNGLAGSLLNFVLQKPFIDKVIVGVQNKEQLQQNVESLKESLVLPELSKQVPDEILKPICWPQYRNV